jgi:hypothetical protein
MALYTTIRTHFSRSLADTVTWMFAWAEDQPPVLRPAYYGALFIWALIIFRGGLVVLPILLLVVLFTDRQAFWQFLLVFCVVAPASGFVGGFLYGMLGPLVNRLGIVGSIVKFAVAASCYFVALFFLIVPLLRNETRPPVTDPGTWTLVGILGVGMGVVLALSTRKDAA